MRIRTKLGFGLAAVALFGGIGFPDAALAQSRIQFVDSGQRLGGNSSNTDVALGDVDGDGDLDAVIARVGTNSQVWINQGTGQFVDGQNLASGTIASVALADLDGDGDLDVFFADRTGPNQIWINQGGRQGGTQGVFLQSSQITPINEPASGIALGLIDGNPGLDAFVTHAGGFAGSTVWTNNGTGQFTFNGQRLSNDQWQSAALGDFDGDGDLDAFVLTASFLPTNTVWRNQGGAFVHNQDLDNATGYGTSVALGDLDGDQDIDAFVAGVVANRVWVNQGGSPGVFAGSGQLFGGNATDAALGDLDGDGDLDAFVACYYGPSQDRVFENDGTGHFTDTGLRLGTQQSFAVALGDLDGDGNLDAFIAKYQRPNEVWFNETPPAVPVPTFPEYIITTIAGTGARGSTGDGGPATNAPLDVPRYVGVDAQGNVYISGGTDHRVRKVATNGIITTFAGTGVPGFSGNDGPATNAQLNGPRGVAVDGVGNVYIADTFNQRIRRVDTNGIITTFAGSGTAGSGGDEGLATAAQLSIPGDVAVDIIGNVYIGTLDRIRKVDTNGIIHTAVVTPGTNLAALAVGPAGNIYFTDHFLEFVCRVDTNGSCTIFAGRSNIFGYLGSGGQATAALFRIPLGVAVDSAGNVFITDAGNYRIRRVDTNGLISTIAGTGAGGFSGDGGPARAANLEGLHGLTVDAAGNVFFIANNRVRRLTPTGRNLRLAPQYAPSLGPLIDFGITSYEEGSPDPKYLRIGNSGTADLSISYVGFSQFDINLSLSTMPTNLPTTIPDGVNASRLDVVIKLYPGVVAAREETLQLVTNDPDTPVATHIVAYRIEADLGLGIFEVLFLILNKLSPGPAAPASAEQLSGHAAKTALSLPETAILEFDPRAPHSLTSEVPAFLGGGSVQLSNFTGSVTVSLLPFPNDPDHAFLRIDSGSFTAPSVQLPSGLRTGPNTLTFGPASQSEGILNLTNGEYTVTATATIVNDLVPQGFPVRGSYRGTFDEATGQASVQSQSRDFFRRSDRVQFSHAPGGLSLTWIGGDALEEATDVLGPWRTVTNGVSPYSVNTTRHWQQFFRLRRLAP